MGLPSVVVGLVVYLLLSRAGPLGSLGDSVHADGDGDRADDPDHADDRRARPGRWSRTRGTNTGSSCARSARRSSAPRSTLLWDMRFSLVTVVLAGFGRAASEVGAVMIVGGNIDGVTRVMTTAIALETSKGDLPLALGLGLHPAAPSCWRSMPAPSSSRRRRSDATDERARSTWTCARRCRCCRCVSTTWCSRSGRGASSTACR